MKRLFVYMAGIAVGILTLVANAGAASASNWMFYESEVPTKLRSK
ncbi:MAG: cyclic lactone autoinducer peptide [Clostridia bacterium]|nr:cyclic lactone autoinducer peptide [Clostridia bacterium]